MPNGDHRGDKNTSRLSMTLQNYHDRYGEWPSWMEIEQRFLDDIGFFVGEDGIASLRQHLEVRIVPDGTLWDRGMRVVTVGGVHGSMTYPGEVNDSGVPYTRPDVSSGVSVASWLGPTWAK